MKTYVLVALVAISSIASVSSAMCMKKFFAGAGINQMPNSNFYKEIQKEASSLTDPLAFTGKKVSAQR